MAVKIMSSVLEKSIASQLHGNSILYVIQPESAGPNRDQQVTMDVLEGHLFGNGETQAIEGTDKLFLVKVDNTRYRTNMNDMIGYINGDRDEDYAFTRSDGLFASKDMGDDPSLRNEFALGDLVDYMMGKEYTDAASIVATTQFISVTQAGDNEVRKQLSMGGLYGYITGRSSFEGDDYYSFDPVQSPDRVATPEDGDYRLYLGVMGVATYIGVSGAWVPKSNLTVDADGRMILDVKDIQTDTLNAKTSITAGKYLGGVTTDGSISLKGITLGADGIQNGGPYNGGLITSGAINLKKLSVGTDGIDVNGLTDVKGANKVSFDSDKTYIDRTGLYGDVDAKISFTDSFSVLKGGIATLDTSLAVTADTLINTTGGWFKNSVAVGGTGFADGKLIIATDGDVVSSGTTTFKSYKSIYAPDKTYYSILNDSGLHFTAEGSASGIRADRVDHKGPTTITSFTNSGGFSWIIGNTTKVSLSTYFNVNAESKFAKSLTLGGVGENHLSLMNAGGGTYGVRLWSAGHFYAQNSIAVGGVSTTTGTTTPFFSVNAAGNVNTKGTLTVDGYTTVKSGFKLTDEFGRSITDHNIINGDSVTATIWDKEAQGTTFPSGFYQVATRVASNSTNAKFRVTAGTAGKHHTVDFELGDSYNAVNITIINSVAYLGSKFIESIHVVSNTDDLYSGKTIIVKLVSQPISGNVTLACGMIDGNLGSRGFDAGDADINTNWTLTGISNVASATPGTTEALFDISLENYNTQVGSFKAATVTTNGFFRGVGSNNVSTQFLDATTGSSWMLGKLQLGGACTSGGSVSSAKISIDGTTGVISATTFTGAFSGNATTATNATNADKLDNVDGLGYARISQFSTDYPILWGRSDATAAGVYSGITNAGWIRMPGGGIIPAVENSGGSGNIGTAAWRFAAGYFQTLNVTGHASIGTITASTVGATTFTGALSGNATTATNAANANLLDNVDGIGYQRVYGAHIGSGVYPALFGKVTAATDGNSVNGWVRTPTSGLLPYSMSSTAGYGSIGTSSWRFSAGYFGALSVYGNIQAGTVGATTFTGALSGNATSSTKARYLEAYGTITSLNTFTPSAGGHLVHELFAASATGASLVGVVNDANSMLTMRTHGQPHWHQLAFSSNGHMYHRTITNNSIGSWGKFWTSKDGTPYWSGSKVADSESLDGRDGLDYMWLDNPSANFPGMYGGVQAGRVLSTMAAWIRTPQSGILPHSQSSTAGASNIGASSWKFTGGYFVDVWAARFNGALIGNASTATTAANANLLDNRDSSTFFRNSVSYPGSTSARTPHTFATWASVTAYPSSGSSIVAHSGYSSTLLYFHQTSGSTRSIAMEISYTGQYTFNTNTDGNKWHKHTVWTSFNGTPYWSGSKVADSEKLDGVAAKYYMRVFTDTASYPALFGGTTTTDILGNGGYIRMPSAGVLPNANGVGVIGTSSWKFLYMYAGTFYGALSGNATTATTAATANNALALGGQAAINWGRVGGAVSSSGLYPQIFGKSTPTGTYGLGGWVRTPNSGILPGVIDVSNLGSVNWEFNVGYINTVQATNVNAPNIAPVTNLTGYVGHSTKRYVAGYINTVYSSTAVTTNVYPGTNSTGTVGTSSRKYANAYITRIDATNAILSGYVYCDQIHPKIQSASGAGSVGATSARFTAGWFKEVTATTFIGNLTGLAAAATGLGDGSGNQNMTLDLDHDNRSYKHITLDRFDDDTGVAAGLFTESSTSRNQSYLANTNGMINFYTNGSSNTGEANGHQLVFTSGGRLLHRTRTWKGVSDWFQIYSSRENIYINREGALPTETGAEVMNTSLAIVFNNIKQRTASGPGGFAGRFISSYDAAIVFNNITGPADETIYQDRFVTFRALQWLADNHNDYNIPL